MQEDILLFLAYPVFFQIHFTSESLSRREILEIGSTENHSLVAPLSHIFLPTRDGVIRICRIAIWLCVGIYGSPFVRLTKLMQSFPPIMQSVVTLTEVVLSSNHSVKEIRTTETGSIDELHSTFAFRYLCRGIAAEAYA